MTIDTTMMVTSNDHDGGDDHDEKWRNGYVDVKDAYGEDECHQNTTPESVSCSFPSELRGVRVQRLQSQGSVQGTGSLHRHVSELPGSDRAGQAKRLLQGSSGSGRQPLLPSQAEERSEAVADTPISRSFHKTQRSFCQPEQSFLYL